MVLDPLDNILITGILKIPDFNPEVLLYAHLTSLVEKIFSRANWMPMEILFG
jgi:hypothetical protein